MVTTAGGAATGAATAATSAFRSTLIQSGKSVTNIGRTTLIHRSKKTQIWQTLVATEDEKLVALIVQTQINL